MPITEAKYRAHRKWNEANLERIQVAVRAGQKAIFKQAADAAGESLNHYIISAVLARIETETGKKISLDTKENPA